MDNFHPLEVVGRGSETQLQVGENLNNPNERFKDKSCRSHLKVFCGDIVNRPSESRFCCESVSFWHLTH